MLSDLNITHKVYYSYRNSTLISTKSEQDLDRDPHWFGFLPESGSALALKPMRIHNTGKNSGTCALAPAQKGVA